MRRIKGRLLSIVMSLVLMASVFTGLNLKTHAAEDVTANVTPVISSDMHVQIFDVYLPVDGEYDVYYNGTLKDEAVPIEAGYHRLTFSVSDPSDEIGLDVWTRDSEDNWCGVMGTSINTYYTTILGVGDDGAVLFEDVSQYLGVYESELTFTAPASYDTGDTVYYCADNMHVLNFGDDGYTFIYTATPKEARTIQINYVDGQNQILGTDSEVLEYNETLNFQAPETYTANEKDYTLRTNGQVTMDYETASDIYTFEYDENIPAPEEPYEIEINFVDADDNNARLYTTRMTLDVSGSVRMELPGTYYSGLKAYQLENGTSNVIEREFSSTRPLVYNIPYRVAAESAPYDVTIYFTGDDGAALGSQTVTLTADGEPWIYDLSSTPSLTSGDTQYYLVNGQGNENGQIVCAYNEDPQSRQLSYQVVYTPENVEVTPPYPVTLRYINVSNNQVLNTQTQEVTAGNSVAFQAAPETITDNGVELVRMNGQENGISHNYNEPRSDYAVYYIDPSVPAPEVQIVDQVVTQYATVDGGTIVTDEAGTAAPQVVPVTAVTTPEGEVQALYNAEGEQVTLEDGVLTPIQDEEVPLADGSAADETDTMTIEDEDTPKADMNRGGIGFPAMLPWLFAGIILIIMAVLFLAQRNKSEK